MSDEKSLSGIFKVLVGDEPARSLGMNRSATRRHRIISNAAVEHQFERVRPEIDIAVQGENEAFVFVDHGAVFVFHLARVQLPANQIVEIHHLAPALALLDAFCILQVNDERKTANVVLSSTAIGSANDSALLQDLGREIVLVGIFREAGFGKEPT